MEHGVLDKVTLDVERFEVWVTDKVTPLSPADALLIQQLAKCVHLARMRALDEAGASQRLADHSLTDAYGIADVHIQ